MPKGQHQPVEVRLEKAKAKRTLCEHRLNALEVKQAQISLKEGKTRNQMARWDAKITRLESQRLAQEAVTPNP